VSLTHVGASAIRLDALQLIGIARGDDSLAVVKDGRVAIGARRAAERVEGRSGDVTAIVGGSGYMTAIGETLTVQFTPSGSESLGSALAVETEIDVDPETEDDGDSREVRVLVPDGHGGWFIVATRSVEQGQGTLIVEGVYSDMVRLVFAGSCSVTGVYQVGPLLRTPASTQLELAAAHHSRTGEMTLGQGGLGGVVLELGEWLDLRFRIPTAGVTPEDVFLMFDASVATASPPEIQSALTPAVPKNFALEQSIPNPFEQTTLIRFALPTRSRVTMELFDLTGRRVRTLARGERAAGVHHVDWNGRDDAGRRLSPGVYVYRLTAGPFQSSRRLILMP
jgi:hypothetical protein